MTTVDERVVSLKFDNAQFEQKAQSSIKVLEKLRASTNLKGASKGLESLGRSAAGFSLNGFARSIGKAQSSLSALEVVGITALSNITNSAINAGKQLAKAFTIDQVKDGFHEYELKMGSMQTIMASTGAKEREVKKYLEELNHYADKTIYSFSDMTDNIGKFTNAGVSLKDSVAAIKGISNEAAVSGANANQASHAMYNFAQALSAGYVKLIDWKSIENAQMATVEFKNELIKTALELGTVSKEGDKFKSTTTNAKGAVSEAFNATLGFNDSLNHQWMTTEVLTKTLAKYANENTKLGKKAFAAAQDVKTFTQMMDTLKEAAGSGWAESFEIIFGSFNGAKKLWTQVAGALSNILDQSAKVRNSMLKTWKELGGRRNLINAVKSAWKDLSMVMNEVKGGFESVVAPMTGKRLAEISKSIRNFIKSITISESSLEYIRLAVAGFASPIKLFKKISADAFNGFKAVVKTTFPTLDHFFTVVGNIGLAVESVSNGFLSVYNMLSKRISPTLSKIVKKIILNPLHPKDITGLPFLQLAESFEEFASSLTLSEDQMNDVRRVLGAVVSVFHLFRTAVKDAGSFILWFARLFSPSIDSVFAFAVALADVVKSISKFILKTRKVIINVNKSLGISKKITKVLRSIVRAITNAVRGVSKKIGSITDSFDAFTGKSDTIESVSNAITGLAKALGGIGSHAIDTIVSLGHAFKEIGKGTFGAVGDELKLIFDKVSSKGLKGFEKLKKILSDKGIKLPNLHLDKWKDNLNKVFGNGADGFQGFASNLLDRVGRLNDDLNAQLLNIDSGNVHGKLNVLFGFVNHQIANLYRTIRSSNVGQFVSEMFKKLGTNILSGYDKISKSGFTKNIGDSFMKLKDSFVKLKDSFKNVDVGTGMKNVAKWFVDTGKAILKFLKRLGEADKPLGKLKKNLGGVAEYIKDVLGSVYDSIRSGDALSDIGDVFYNISDAISNFMDSISPAKVAALVFAGFVGILAFSIVTLVNSMSYAIQQFGTFMSSSGSLALSLKTLADNFSNTIEPIKSRKTTIREVSQAIAILAGALYLLSKVPKDDLIKAGVAMAGLAVGLAALAFVLSTPVFSNFKAKKAVALVPIAAAILVLVGTLKLLSTIKMSDFDPKVLAALVPMIWALVAVTIAANFLGSKLSPAVGLSVLAFAASLLILVKALESLSKIDLSGMKATIEQVGEVFALLVGLAIAGAAFSLSGGAGLLLGVLALNLLLPALEKITQYDYSGISNAIKENAGIIILVGVLFAALAALMVTPIGRNLGNNMKALGTGFMAMGAALVLMTTAVYMLGNMDPSVVNRGIKAVTGMVLLLTLFGVLVGIASRGNYKGLAMSLIGLSLAVTMLITAVYVLGSINKSALQKGIAAVGAIIILMGLFSLISSIPANYKAQNFKNIIAAAAGIAIVATAFIAISFLPWKGIQKGFVGLLACFVAFGGILAVIGLLGKHFKPKAIGVIVAAALALGTVAVALYALASRPWEKLVAAGVSLAAGMMAFAGVFAVMLVLGDAASASLPAVGIILVALVAFGAVAAMIYLLSTKDTNKIAVAAAAISAGLLALNVTLAVATVVGAAAPAAIAGLAILLGFVAAVLGFVEAVGAINQATGGKLSEFASSFGDIIGNIVSGFTGAATKNFGEVGKNLGDFATNAKPFFDMAGQLDTSKISSMTQLFGALGELSFDNKFDSKAIVDFATGLSKLKQPLQDLSNIMISSGSPNQDGLTEKQVENIKKLAGCIKPLVEIANDIPNQGGELKKLVGDNTLKQFGQGLQDFLPALLDIGSAMNLGKKVKDDTINEKQISMIRKVGRCIKPLVEVANDIPNEGDSALKLLVGDNTLGKFGEGLKQFIPSLVEIGNAITPLKDSGKAGLNDDQIKGIKSVAGAIKPLIEVANAIPNEGGALAEIVGDNTLAKFGEQIGAFAPSLQKLGSLFGAGTPLAAGGITQDQIVSIAMMGEALKVFAEVATMIPESQGLGNAWSGTQDIGAFAQQLATAAGPLQEFFTMVNGLAGYDLSNVTAITSLFESMAIVTNGDYNLDPSRLAALTNSITQMIPKFKEIVQATQGLGDTTNLKNIGDALKSLGEISGIDIDFSKLDTGGKGLKEGAKKINEGANELDKGKPGEKVKKNVKTVQEGLNNASKVKSDAHKNIEKGLKGFKKAINDNDVGSKGKKIAKNLTDTTKEITKANKEGSKVKPENTKKTLDPMKELKKLAEEGTGGDLKEMTKAYQEFGSTQKDIFNADTNEMLKEYGVNMEELVNGKDIDFSKFGQSAKGGFETFVNSLKGAFAKSKTETDKGKKNFTTAGTHLGQALGKGFKPSPIKSKVKTALTSAKATITGSRGSWSSAGSSLAAGLAAGIASGASSVINAAINIAKSAIEAAKSALSINSPSKEFIKIGNSINEGFTKGINNSGTTINAAANVAKSTIKVTKKVLDSHSPSKVFETIGEDTTLGFANGFRSGAEIVMGEVNSIGTSMVTAAKTYAVETGMIFEKTAKKVAGKGKKKGKSPSDAKKMGDTWEWDTRYKKTKKGYKNVTAEFLGDQFKNKNIDRAVSETGTYFSRKVNAAINKILKATGKKALSVKQMQNLAKPVIKQINYSIANLTALTKSFNASQKKILMSSETTVAAFLKNFKAPDEYAKGVISSFNKSFSKQIREIKTDGVGKVITKYNNTVKQLTSKRNNAQKAMRTLVEEKGTKIKGSSIYKKLQSDIKGYNKALNELKKLSGKINTFKKAQRYTNGKNVINDFANMLYMNTDDYKQNVKDMKANNNKITANNKKLVKNRKNLAKANKELANAKKIKDKKKRKSAVSKAKAKVDKYKGNIKDLTTANKELVKSNDALAKAMAQGPIKALKEFKAGIKSTVKAVGELSSIQLADDIFSGFNWEKSTSTFNAFTEATSKSLKGISTVASAAANNTATAINLITQAAETAKQAISTQEEAFDIMSASLSTGINLFEKFTRTGTAEAQALIEHAQTQIDAYTEWYQLLDDLKSIGLDQSVIDDLEAQGVNGINYARGFKTMSEEQIKQYNELAKKREEIDQKTMERSLEKQAAEYDTWMDNITTKLAGVVGDDFIKKLKAAGVSQANFVAMLVRLPLEKLQNVEKYYTKSISTSLTEFAKELPNGGKSFLDQLLATNEANRTWEEKLEKVRKVVGDDMTESFRNSGRDSAEAWVDSILSEDFTSDMLTRLKAAWDEYVAYTNKNNDVGTSSSTTSSKYYLSDAERKALGTGLMGDMKREIAEDAEFERRLAFIEKNGRMIDRTITEELRGMGRDSAKAYVDEIYNTINQIIKDNEGVDHWEIPLEEYGMELSKTYRKYNNTGTLLENLRKSNDAEKVWQQQLKDLKKKGYSDDVVEYFREQGREAAQGWISSMMTESKAGVKEINSIMKSASTVSWNNGVENIKAENKSYDNYVKNVDKIQARIDKLRKEGHKKTAAGFTEVLNSLKELGFEEAEGVKMMAQATNQEIWNMYKALEQRKKNNKDNTWESLRTDQKEASKLQKEYDRLHKVMATDTFVTKAGASKKTQEANAKYRKELLDQIEAMGLEEAVRYMQAIENGMKTDKEGFAEWQQDFIASNFSLPEKVATDVTAQYAATATGAIDAINAAAGDQAKKTSGKVTKTWVKAISDALNNSDVQAIMDSLSKEISKRMYNPSALRKTGKKATATFAKATAKATSDTDVTTSTNSVGTAISSGIAKGINTSKSKVTKAAVKVAKSALDAAKEELGIKSPSKAFAEIGMYVNEGFAQGLESSSTMPIASIQSMNNEILAYMVGAASMIADQVNQDVIFDPDIVVDESKARALDSMRQAIETMILLANEDIDTNPVITPELDLSEVRKNAQELSSMMDENQMKLHMAQQTADTEAQAAGMTFIQNNYSPKALSPLEIYRQSENLIARTRGMVRTL